MCNCDAEYAEDEAAGLRAELAKVTAERDALLAGKWAGPWHWRDGIRARWTAGDHPAAEIEFFGPGWMWRVGYEPGVKAESLEEAEAAADAELKRLGGWLSNDRSLLPEHIQRAEDRSGVTPTIPEPKR